MKLRTILAAGAVASLALPAGAAAQTAPVGGGTEIGGSVPSFLELVLTQPAKGFATFSKARSYEMSFTATAISTDAPTLLSIADGDATSGSKLGYITIKKKRLPSPLEARVGKSAFQPLNDSVDPLLTRWTETTGRANGAVTVKLRQKVKKKTTGSYRKLVWATLSTEAP